METDDNKNNDEKAQEQEQEQQQEEEVIEKVIADELIDMFLNGLIAYVEGKPIKQFKNVNALRKLLDHFKFTTEDIKKFLAQCEHYKPSRKELIEIARQYEAIYKSKTIKQLKEELTKKNLSKTGKKQDLIDTIVYEYMKSKYNFNYQPTLIFKLPLPIHADTTQVSKRKKNALMRLPKKKLQIQPPIYMKSENESEENEESSKVNLAYLSPDIWKDTTIEENKFDELFSVFYTSISSKQNGMDVAKHYFCLVPQKHYKVDFVKHNLFFKYAGEDEEYETIPVCPVTEKLAECFEPIAEKNPLFDFICKGMKFWDFANGKKVFKETSWDMLHSVIRITTQGIVTIELREEKEDKTSLIPSQEETS